MKRKILLFAVVGVLFVSSISCSRKINGATPHRKERNCGCENLNYPQNNDYQILITENTSTDESK